MSDQAAPNAERQATPADQMSDAVEALRAAFAPCAGPDGIVMETSVWLVTATR